MATDYNEKVLDILAAFGADGFHYGSGSFYRTHTHDVGSMGWPWEFRHSWKLSRAPWLAYATARDAAEADKKAHPNTRQRV